MKKTDTDPTLPTALSVDDPNAVGFRVVDAKTGETIERVTAADAEAGTLTRFAIEDGNLVREGDKFRMVSEERVIRIERKEPITTGDMVAGAAGDAG